MKKAYNKPQFNIEYLAMTQNIAGSCGVPGGGSTLGRPSHWGKSDCGWAIGDDIIWVSEPACNDIDDPNIEIDGICYNNPEGGLTIFGSY